VLAGSTTFTATTTANPLSAGPLNGVGDVLVLSNIGSQTVYASIAGPAAVGGSASIVVPAGQRRVLSVNIYVSGLSVVTASGTTTVVCELGTGTVFA
jgi:hypothetical protein